jgi:lysozyme
MTVLGIDLNRYRPGFDIALAKQHGVRYVIAKATEVWPGTQWKDPTYDGYRNQCKANDVPFGAYLYWRAEVEPEEQVDYYFEVVKKHIDLPPIIDVERHNNTGFSVGDVRDSLLETYLLLEDIYNLPPIIYTSWWSWRSLTNDYDLIGVAPLWVANFTNHHTPLLPAPAEEWEFWQFTASYPLPGQPKTCDANRFNGTEPEFNEYVKVSKSIMYPDANPPDDGDDVGMKDIYIELDGKPPEGIRGRRDWRVGDKGRAGGSAWRRDNRGTSPTA